MRFKSQTRYLCLGLLPVLTLGTALLSTVPDLSKDEQTLQLARAIVHVITRYIGPMTNTLVITEHCERCNQAESQRNSLLLNKVLQRSSIKLAMLLYVSTSDEYPWDYSVFIVNTPRDFDKLRFSLPPTLNDREFNFLVVLTLRLHAGTLKRNVRKICVNSFKFRVVNIVVMVQHLDGRIELYCYRLKGPDCMSHGLYIEKFNSFVPRTGRLEHDELFPLHFRDLHNCALNVSAQLIAPHFMYWGEKLPPEGAIIDVSHLKGIDGELLSLLAKTLKFRVRLCLSKGSNEVFGPTNMTGSFAQVALGNSEFSMGGLSGAGQYRYLFSISNVYQLNYLVFVVRRDGLLDQFVHLVRPFHHKVWIAVLLSLVLAAVAVHLMTLPHPFECLLAMTLGNVLNVRRLPRKCFLRYLLGSWLLLTLVLRSAYQGKMFDILRASKQMPVPGNRTELLAKNYTLVSNVYHDFYPQHMTLLLPNTTFQARFKLLLQAAPEQRLVTISLLSNVGHWNWLHRRSQLLPIQQPISLYQLVMYFHKHSIFKFVFDRKIEQLLSSGILHHWEKRYMRGFEYGSGFVAKKPRKSQRPVSRINNSMFWNVYCCYFGLMTAAGLVMCLELLAAHVTSLRWLLNRLQ